jgi:hypothetical protein
MQKTNVDVPSSSDGGMVHGSLLAGANDSNSKVRCILCPDTGSLNQLPVRFIGVTLRLMTVEIETLRSVDPLLFQGYHADTRRSSRPLTRGVDSSTRKEESFEEQISVSWRAGNGVPRSNREDR